MKNFLITFFLISIFTFASQAQRSDADKFNTSEGPLNIQPILHGTLALTWNNLTIINDPYGGAKAFEGIAVPDLVLITDIHGDHLNKETLGALDMSKSSLVVPQAVADQLPENLKPKAVIINNGESKTVKGIEISAIPMYNLPDDASSRHTKGRGNGYILNLGGKHVYISGDTEDIPEMRNLTDIDIAFVCMNLPYTMDIDQAASAVLEFKPKIVYPFHYRGQGGLNDVEGFKKLVNDKNNDIEVRLRNWYPQYE